MARYSLDLDGVVADYFTARAEVVQKLGIRPLTQPVGLKPEELDIFMGERVATINKVMKEYISDNLEEFFGGLGCLLGQDDRREIGRAAAVGHELFWVSARSFFGDHSFTQTSTEFLKQITVGWLDKNDLPCDPAHVILTPDKAAVMNTQDIRFHLDDNVAHVTSIALGSQAKVFLLRQPWNQHFFIRHPDEPDADYFTSAGAYGVSEVDSVAEYITLLTGGK